jgi:hypothetical protein
VRLWLDEMIDGAVAAELRNRGYDVLAVQDPDQIWARGLDDERQLDAASSGRRALVTFNVSDFAVISREWAEAGREHFGILLVHPHTTAQKNIGALIHGLARFLDAHPAEDALASQVMYLPL